MNAIIRFFNKSILLLLFCNQLYGQSNSLPQSAINEYAARMRFAHERSDHFKYAIFHGLKQEYPYLSVADVLTGMESLSTNSEFREMTFKMWYNRYGAKKDLLMSELINIGMEAKNAQVIIDYITNKEHRSRTRNTINKENIKDIINNDTILSRLMPDEINPEPPGGMKAFMLWASSNYEYPQAALENGINGVVEVSFVVEKDGSLTDINVKRDLKYGTGDAAVKLLKKAKKWKPGIQNGRPVRVAYTLPIRLNTIQN
jgi:TonB family protein